MAAALRTKFKEETLLSEEQLPFIACCTAYDEASFKRRALQAGMDSFMSKPLSDADLRQLIDLHLKR